MATSRLERLSLSLAMRYLPLVGRARPCASSSVARELPCGAARTPFSSTVSHRVDIDAQLLGGVIAPPLSALALAQEEVGACALDHNGRPTEAFDRLVARGFSVATGREQGTVTSGDAERQSVVTATA